MTKPLRPPSDAPPRPRALRSLRRLNSLVQAQLDLAVREHGISSQQWELVMRLRRSGPLEAGELADALGVAPPSVTALVDSAERRGLVARHDHATDRRRRLIELTPHGSALASCLPHAGRTVGRRMTRDFSEAERLQLVELLDRAAANLTTEVSA